ncbi:Aste57867_21466 [Aphanomyces stellatus]|uniref:Aste57867_21466 protein n=1 Tax=Aphanomyces stellatus TaxID=120398 RepID=A0A485LHL8_9STRA|nr:hypothetical protein As57867_021397 [Aphanomyces stellatus]VFT98137.1 Aste57867_21466 [Aphanomyces stellatus]
MGLHQPYCLEAEGELVAPNLTLVDLFHATAARFPDHVALSCGTDMASTQVVQLTYAETLRRATHVAQTLQTTFPACRDKSFVLGILLDKGLTLTLSILATTFAGATWLPFDPDAPADRVAICLRDAGAVGLVFDDSHALVAARALQDVTMCQPLLYDDVEAASTSVGGLLGAAPTPTTPAYYIYTSGTTGTPKGISISHCAAATFAYSESSVLGLTSDDVVWNGFSPAFDMWIEETWCAFARGCHVAVGLSGQWHDIANLCRVWDARNVTVLMAVPTLMAIICNESVVPSRVRLINLGGEVCPPALVARLHRPNLQIFNTYGPSETTVTATYSIVTPDKAITIGKPLPNYHVLILQDTSHETTPQIVPLPLANGVTGELAIGGPCVGDGYVGRPDLTAVKFVPHPTRGGETIYRSGDLVSLNTAGEIVFVDRIDTQVKYRGFRIELGEIEDKLCAQDGVLATAVILAKGDDDMEAPGAIPTRLEAYVVMAQDKSMDSAAMRKALASTLMAYMLPDVLFQLTETEMPRLHSGKINKKGLVVISDANRTNEKLAFANQSKRQTPVATSLDFVLEVLGHMFPTHGAITADLDFFTDLGGHSLLVATLASNLRQGHVNFAENPYEHIGLADIYVLRTAQKLSEKFAVASSPAPLTKRDFHTVSTIRYVVCGLVQLPFLAILFAMHAASLVGPFVFAQVVYNQTASFWRSLLAMYVYYWLLLGKVEPGDHPLFGWFYIRWWFVSRVNDLVDKTMWSDSRIMVVWLTFFGAQVGNHVHIGSTNVICADLITIGNGVTISHQVILGCEVVDQGLLKLRPITIGNSVYVGTSVTLEGNVRVLDSAEISSMSGVPEGTVVPAAQVWSGSPAQFESTVKGWSLHNAPPKWKTNMYFVVQFLLLFVVVPLLHMIPLFPVMAFYREFLTRNHWLTEMLSLAAMSSLAYIALTITLLAVLKHVVLGKVQAGSYSTTSSFFLRKWLIDGVMHNSLGTLHTVYATLYVTPFLRLLGANIGARAEVSTARHMTVDLLAIGDESFVADHVLLGDDHVRGYTLTLKHTTLGHRSFTGNRCLVPQGSSIAPNTLVGVFSKPPFHPPLQDGESCFGLPAILMPTRRNATKDYDTALLFNPPPRLIALRLFVEGVRILYAPMMISLGIAGSLHFVLQFFPFDGDSKTDIAFEVLVLVVISPAYYVTCFVAPGILVTLVLKWILVGTYKPVECPMWSLQVWLSEFITTIIEHLTPIVLLPFVGTPYLPMIYRLYGCKIGRRCYLGVLDVPEFDCVEIGDDCAFNLMSFPQTHLFEDRVMKLGRVHVGHRCTMRLNAILLPQSSMQDDTAIGCNSVAMKGEQLTSGYEWYGFPVDIRKEGARIEPDDRGARKEWVVEPSLQIEESENSQSSMSGWIHSVGSRVYFTDDGDVTYERLDSDRIFDNRRRSSQESYSVFFV